MGVVPEFDDGPHSTEKEEKVGGKLAMAARGVNDETNIELNESYREIRTYLTINNKYENNTWLLVQR